MYYSLWECFGQCVTYARRRGPVRVDSDSLGELKLGSFQQRVRHVRISDVCKAALVVSSLCQEGGDGMVGKSLVTRFQPLVSL